VGELDAEGPRLSHQIVSNSDGRVVLALGGELDMSTVEELRSAVEGTVAAATDLLVLDVEQLRFADSSALALWVNWSQHVRRVEVHNARPMIRRVIDAMGLTTKLNPV
jgi:anti-anti-sigma factor